MTIHDLHDLLDERSSGAPGNARRMAEIHRRIRRSARRRLAAGALAGAAVLVVAGGLLQWPGDGVTRTTPLTSATTGRPEALTEPPEVFAGMGRVAYGRYNLSGTITRLDVTPQGPDSAIVATCPAGFELLQRTPLAGTRLTRCDTRGGKPAPVPVTPPGEFLENGGPTRLEVAILPEGVAASAYAAIEFGSTSPQAGVDRTSIKLEALLAGQPRKPADWSVAVYSGTCTDRRWCVPVR
ncbi:hypothetical protein Misp01_65410 [Microtetraspora sp. NBRC 13810]|uniref:hypothetical protein n=1 Tax=Microtetraspora sp. NBRC 13810 TaxID=3030990 RepID=UPI0024A1F134|nr:hypothetical protein [Microtetraspora sp. NBRC 13810]GLW11413.1 hypothetical protein Misp01_65410 [Microtetraspora sp. NBRC 13810]